MKINLKAAGQDAWDFLTVIPGWPDAGRIARTLYVLPLVVPFIALLGLAGWNRFSREPRIREVRAICQPALQLEEEIAALRLQWSEDQATESAASTAALTAGLLRGPEDLDLQVAAMRKAAAAHGWVPTVHANDPDVENPGSTGLVHRSVRGRLVPAPENRAAFVSLLSLLEQLPPAGKHGSLTRLTVRADEQGRLAVEFGVRYAARPPDAKTP